MTGLEALKQILEATDTNFTYQYHEDFENPIKIIEKELKVLDILKKHCINDGWSNGYLIRFWEMNANELKKVKEWWLKNE